MDFGVLIPLIFAALFLMIDVAMLVRMIYLLKKSNDDTADNLANKLNPYLTVIGAVSILMGICMVIVTVMK